jgi:thioesterase domain-containing protein
MGLRGLVPGSSAIFAVQSRALVSDEPEVGAVAQMAEAYAELVASLGASPVRLFGWSLGGVIAHAVAAVLEGRVSVHSVGMVDPPEPGMGVGVHENVMALTGIVRDRNPAAAPGALKDLVADAGSKHRPVREWLAECEARDLLPARAVTADEFERAWHLYRAHARLIAEFSPRPIEAPLQLWWAQRRASSRWVGSTYGTVRERLVGGTHYTIMRMPSVQAIAEEL